MNFKTKVLSGTVLSAVAGSMLLAASAFAQTASPSDGAPAGSMSQPSATEPGMTPQPNAQTHESMPGASDMSSPQTPMSSSTMGAQQSSSSAMMKASAGEPLSKVKHAKTTLASASVQDSTGQPIGQVKDVHTTRHGTPTMIDVMLQTSGGESKTVAIKASKLHYDQSSNTLKTDLTSTEVQAMPKATGM
ncbi:MAG TPA: hypothetical protein VII49_02945 [Rhizomicrobium sp.]